jgi:hypothetical protein
VKKKVKTANTWLKPVLIGLIGLIGLINTNLSASEQTARYITNPRTNRPDCASDVTVKKGGVLILPKAPEWLDFSGGIDITPDGNGVKLNITGGGSYNVQGHIKSKDNSLKITNDGVDNVDLSINGVMGSIVGVKSFGKYDDPVEHVLFTLPTGCIITSYIARLDIPYNGTAPEIQIGVRGIPGMIAPPGDISLQGDVGSISKAMLMTLPQRSPTDIIATYKADGSSEGSLRIIITYLIAEPEAEK